MKNADEPLEEDLAEFERKLAFAIETAKQKSKPKDSDLEKLSWDGLCQTCVQMF
jgi:hypothetical protein